MTTANPARGKRRRLKADRPRHTWLEVYELRALYVMDQMGHTSLAMALEVYARVVDRPVGVGPRMDDLLRGADRALTGTSEPGQSTRDELVGLSNGGQNGSF